MKLKRKGGTEAAVNEDSVFSGVALRIIEDLTDGLVILDQKKEILFVNESLLKMTGLRSKDILTKESSFLEQLQLEDIDIDGKRIELPDNNGKRGHYILSSLKIMSSAEPFYLIRIRQIEDEEESRLYYFREHYKILFNHIRDPLLTVDLRGRIIAANPAFYHLLEYGSGSGPDNISAVYVYKQALEDKIMKLAELGSIDNLDTYLYTKEKIIKRVLDCSWIVKDEKGTIKGYTSHLRDVTYLKNLESRLQISEKNYMMLFDKVISSITIVDPLGKVVNRNYASEIIYGYSWEEIVGRDFDELFYADKNRPKIREIFDLVDRNEGRYVESNVPRLCENGKLKYTYASYEWVKNSMNEIIAYAIMERDFTERVKLEWKLKEAFKEIKETQSAAILGFAKLTEYRDKDTGNHLDRIKSYTKVIASELRKLPKYKKYITDEYIEDLCLSSVLHDIGKVGLEDTILLKRGKLNEEEFERIKRHVEIGGEALNALDAEISRESFLTLGKEIAYYHHEWWNGEGYPKGKRGTEIPLSARIVALSDVYDALTTYRPYKNALTHEEAVEEIKRERGSHFDPDVVDAFIAKNEQFKRIKMFGELHEHPETIEDLFKGKLSVDLRNLKMGD